MTALAIREDGASILATVRLGPVSWTDGSSATNFGTTAKQFLLLVEVFRRLYFYLEPNMSMDETFTIHK